MQRYVVKAEPLFGWRVGCPGLTADELVDGLKSNQLAVLSMPHVVIDAVQWATVLQTLRVSEGKFDDDFNWPVQEGVLLVSRPIPFAFFQQMDPQKLRGPMGAICFQRRSHSVATEANSLVADVR